MIVPFSLSCCPACRQNKVPFGDIAFSCLAQLFALSVVVIHWELMKTGCSGKYLNYCNLFEGLNYLAVLVMTLPWRAERADIPMAIFLMLLVRLPSWCLLLTCGLGSCSCPHVLG